MTGPETFRPFEETEEGKPDQKELDPERSQFKFAEGDITPAKREEIIQKMFPNKITRERTPEDVINFMVKAKIEEMEEEIREKQDEDRDRVSLDELTETEEAGGK